MTQDEIIEMANEVNLCQSIWIDGPDENLASLVAFAKLVAAKEREACALLCEEERINAQHYSATTQSNWLAIKIRSK